MNSIFAGLDTAGKIKALMAIKGITQPELAKVMGVSLGTIGNRFESGRWTLNELKRIAVEYNIEVNDLI
uniref:Putative DNA binding, helix-turn-helix domain containing protein n=1 Tax=viral metagenome TaxID=1070528 RepID=A0A6M3JE36_9ZZZZ